MEAFSRLWPAALAACAGAYAGLLSALRSLEQWQEQGGGHRWWFGYLRDAVNLVAAGSLFALLRGAGSDGPFALAAACAIELVTYLIDAAVGRLLGRRRLAWPAAAIGGAGFGLLLLLWPPARAALTALLLAASRA